MTAHEKAKAALVAMRARERAAKGGVMAPDSRADLQRLLAYAETTFALIDAEARYYVAAAAHGRTGSEADKAALEAAEDMSIVALRAHQAALISLGEP